MTEDAGKPGEPRTAGGEAPANEKVRLNDPVEVGQDPARAPTGWAPPKGSRRTHVIVAGVAIAGVLLVLYAWGLPPFTNRIESTDNAYVRGLTTVVSPQVSGYVATVPVQDYQIVDAGQILVTIEDPIFRQRVEQAQASLDAQIANLNNSEQSERSREATVLAQQASLTNAQAQLLRAQADMRRVDELVADGSVSLRERDQTRAALRQAEAAVEQARAAKEVAQQELRAVRVGRAGLQASVEAARANLHLAEIDLGHTGIRAPQRGRLSETGVRVGQYVTAGTQLMFLVPSRVWIIANYKEAQTAYMAPGQPARIRVDALDNARLTGRVEQMSPAAGSEFSVIKPDNATGNFVKVAQRISVRIALDPDQPLVERLRPGMSVETEVDTRGGTKAGKP